MKAPGSIACLNNHLSGLSAPILANSASGLKLYTYAPDFGVRLQVVSMVEVVVDLQA